MPAVPCCPGTFSQSKLNLRLIPTSTGCDNLVTECSFPFNEGRGGRTFGPLEFGVECTGNSGPGGMFRLTYRLSACGSSGSQLSDLDGCFPLSATFTTVTINGSCCVNTPGQSADVRIDIFDGISKPDGTPPRVPPPPPPPCGCATTGRGVAASCSAGGLSPPVYSERPVRYATGELYVVEQDIDAGGFGLPWGHTRSFAGRQSKAKPSATASIGTLPNGSTWSSTPMAR